VQFLFWTLGGLYFSWTNIDRIHGDHFQKAKLPPPTVPLALLSNLRDTSFQIHSLEAREILGIQYLWVNGEKLIDAKTGQEKLGISEEEAVDIAGAVILPGYQVRRTDYITEVGPHHEYRGQALPAWVITYEGDEQLKAYVSARDGKIQRVRHDSWRIFDFLWMLHIMDYNTRDDINNWVLRGFSVLGIFTICSGFLLFGYSSRTLKSWRKTRKSSAKRSL
jgi:hypothetical protein